MDNVHPILYLLFDVCLFGFTLFVCFHLLFDVCFFVFTSAEGIPSCVVRPIKGVPSRVSISERFSGGQSG